MIIEEKETDPFNVYFAIIAVFTLIEFIAQIFIKYF